MLTLRASTRLRSGDQGDEARVFFLGSLNFLGVDYGHADEVSEPGKAEHQAPAHARFLRTRPREWRVCANIRLDLDELLALIANRYHHESCV